MPRTQERREAEAAFMIGVDPQDVLEHNAIERAEYGDPEWGQEMRRLGLLDDQNQITKKGWDQLNKDIALLERNSLRWMRKKFLHVRDEGHDFRGDLVGAFWFDPNDYDQAWLVELAIPAGSGERIDMVDGSYGDLADSAFDGVSDFGGSVLGGMINFSHVQPEDIEAIEATLERRERRRR